MRIDSSGNVGIGTTSIASRLHVESSGGDAHLTLKGTNYGVLYRRGSDNELIGFTGSGGAVNLGASNLALSAPNSSGNIVFQTAGTSAGDERMRIDSSGNVLIGKTSSSFDTAGTHIDADGQIFKLVKSGTGAGPLILNRSTNVGKMIEFYRGSTNLIGNIDTNNTSTAYNTSGSDRTLKKNFESWNENVLNLFKGINPQKFNFIQEDDGAEKSKGFVAQDMVSSFPEAYTKGEEEDAKYFFNPSGMVVYLMKAIQELEAKVEALEAA
tara:strand:- start:66 stop:869 length:804 start_codon:yes stop_codon:yes gene_type:complete